MKDAMSPHPIKFSVNVILVLLVDKSPRNLGSIKNPHFYSSVQWSHIHSFIMLNLAVFY